MQHHTVLKTSFTLYPPLGTLDPPHLRIELKQGSFFTVRPSPEFQSESTVPEWYPGNIYAIERAIPVTVPLPILPSKSVPTTYDIFVSGDYEVRLCLSFFFFICLTSPD